MNAIAITPVWNESAHTIEVFYAGMRDAQKELGKRGTSLFFSFLDDAAINLPKEYSEVSIVRHKRNEGLARTLLDGYWEAFRRERDIVVRLDCQEHNPAKIVDIVESFAHSPIDALFLPVWYWQEGQPRPLMRDISRMMVEFADALSPIKEDVVLGTYNQKFPLGFQAFRTSLLGWMTPRLLEGVDICEKITGKPATWGLDLLAILLAAHEAPDKIDFLFGGWSEPWKENRGADKIAAQREKARIMVEVAKGLNLPTA